MDTNRRRGRYPTELVEVRTSWPRTPHTTVIKSKRKGDD